MDNLNDLKKIWLTADTSSLPDTAEMMRAVRKYRSQKLIKKAALVLAALFLTAVMVSVVFLYKSVMISTRLGEACIIVAGLILVFTNIGSIGRLYKVKNLSNKEFIAYLEQVKINRAKYYRKTQVIGFSLVSLGLLLYIYEGVRAYTWLLFASYAFVLLYIIIMWLVVRPRVYKRQAKKLDATINKMKRLADQF
ncbi:MAG: hypothetical protein ACTHJ0_03680 [Flavipsychrobacter sp.]